MKKQRKQRVSLHAVQDALIVHLHNIEFCVRELRAKTNGEPMPLLSVIQSSTEAALALIDPADAPPPEDHA
jgi:hypothetical protein